MNHVIHPEADAEFLAHVRHYREIERPPGSFPPMKEITFEVREDEVDGGCAATALGVGVHPGPTAGASPDPKPAGNNKS